MDVILRDHCKKSFVQWKGENDYNWISNECTIGNLK